MVNFLDSRPYTLTPLLQAIGVGSIIYHFRDIIDTNAGDFRASHMPE